MTAAIVSKIKLTPPEVAALWGISVEKVLNFIRSGELRALNGASPGRNQRPRYLIDIADLADFERRRAAGPAPKQPPAGETAGGQCWRFLLKKIPPSDITSTGACSDCLLNPRSFCRTFRILSKGGKRHDKRKRPSAGGHPADGHQKNGHPQSSTADNAAIDNIIPDENQKKISVTRRGPTDYTSWVMQ